MRNKHRTENAFMALCVVIVIACFAGMLSLGGCVPPEEDPIPQEYPEEEIRPAETGESASALALAEDGALGVRAASGGRYDRDRALWYVERFAKDPNGKFAYCGDRTWDGSFTPADCTNFASQVLWHGGLPMRSKSAGDPGWWSKGGCRDWSSSPSWRQVYPLIHELLSVSRRGEVVRDLSRLRIGDLIFYRLRTPENGYECPPDKVYNHATIVSGFDSDGAPLVSYHSNDALHVRWDNARGRGGLGNACGWLLVHIKD